MLRLLDGALCPDADVHQNLFITHFLFVFPERYQMRQFQE